MWKAEPVPGPAEEATAPPPERLARYRWAGELARRRRVLDAACGAGWGTALLAERAGSAIGVDLSPVFVAQAQEAHGGVAEFLEGDLRELPFGDGEFDLAVCFEALTHVAEPERALDELRRVLREDGLLLVSAPNRLTYPPGNPLQLSELSPGELQEMLAGRFANVATYGQQTYFASLLGTGELLEGAGEDVEIDTRVGKLCAGPPGGELHTVAAASDGELPPPPAELALGEEVGYEAQRRSLEEWQLRAVEAEAEAEALRRELRSLQG